MPKKRSKPVEVRAYPQPISYRVSLFPWRIREGSSEEACAQFEAECQDTVEGFARAARLELRTDYSAAAVLKAVNQGFADAIGRRRRGHAESPSGRIKLAKRIAEKATDLARELGFDPDPAPWRRRQGASLARMGKIPDPIRYLRDFVAATLDAHAGSEETASSFLDFMAGQLAGEDYAHRAFLTSQGTDIARVEAAMGVDALRRVLETLPETLVLLICVAECAATSIQNQNARGDLGEPWIDILYDGMAEAWNLMFATSIQTNDNLDDVDTFRDRRAAWLKAIFDEAKDRAESDTIRNAVSDLTEGTATTHIKPTRAAATHIKHMRAADRRRKEKVRG